MTAARRVSRGYDGGRPAKTASWIIAWMRGLAAKCAGAAMSRALLYPIPDWPADVSTKKFGPAPKRCKMTRVHHRFGGVTDARGVTDSEV